MQCGNAVKVRERRHSDCNCKRMVEICYQKPKILQKSGTVFWNTVYILETARDRSMVTRHRHSPPTGSRPGRGRWLRWAPAYALLVEHGCYGALIGSHNSHVPDPCEFRWPWVTPKGKTRETQFFNVRTLVYRLTNSDKIWHNNPRGEGLVVISQVKVKVKVHTLDIAPLRCESPPQKCSGVVLVLKGFHSFTCIHTFIRNRNEPYLPLLSQL